MSGSWPRRVRTQVGRYPNEGWPWWVVTPNGWWPRWVVTPMRNDTKKGADTSGLWPKWVVTQKASQLDFWLVKRAIYLCYRFLLPVYPNLVITSTRALFNQLARVKAGFDWIASNWDQIFLSFLLFFLLAFIPFLFWGMSHRVGPYWLAHSLATPLH